MDCLILELLSIGETGGFSTNKYFQYKQINLPVCFLLCAFRLWNVVKARGQLEH